MCDRPTTKTNKPGVLFFSVFAIFVFASGRIITVGKEATSQFSSIQEAINFANSGDVVEILPGEYYESIVVNKSKITIRGKYEENPPTLSGADEVFLNSNPIWEQVQGKIYRTSYAFPFPHVTISEFSKPNQVGTPYIQVYEGRYWLRGYHGDCETDSSGNWNSSYPYSRIEELNPYTDTSSIDRRDVLIPGRFMYDESSKYLYVWGAKENNETHPSNHKYYIPIRKNIVLVKKRKVVIKNLIIMHSYYYGIFLEQGGEDCVIESNYIVNTGPNAIKSGYSKNLVVKHNFIKIFGYYERNDYLSVRCNLQMNYLLFFWGDSKGEGIEVYKNVIYGTNAVYLGTHNLKLHDNIISHSQSIGVFIIQYSKNSRVYRNILHDIYYYAFATMCYNQHGPNYIYRNIIYNTGTFNKEQRNENEVENREVYKYYAYHNSFFFGTDIISIVYYQTGIKTQTVFRNNIFYFSDEFHRGSLYWRLMQNGDPGMYNDVDADYNLYWKEPHNDTSNSYIACFKKYGETANTCFLDTEFEKVQEYSGIDVNGMQENPKFVNQEVLKKQRGYDSSSFDGISSQVYEFVLKNGFKKFFKNNFKQQYSFFKTKKSSPAVNRGTKLNYPDSESIRDFRPDIGAFEDSETFAIIMVVLFCSTFVFCVILLCVVLLICVITFNYTKFVKNGD